MTNPETSRKPVLDFTRLIRAVHAYREAKSAFDMEYDRLHIPSLSSRPADAQRFLEWTKKEPDLRLKLGAAERNIILEAESITAYFDSQQGNKQSSQIGG